MKRLLIILSLLLSHATQSDGQIQMLFSSDSLALITSPLDLDSLFYWYAADVGVTDSLGGAIATDEGVGTWADLSGNGHDVTQATNGARPVWKSTGGPGGYPAIQFDGSNDFLASAAHWWGSDDLTIFLVMKFANATRDAAEYVLGKYQTVTPANTRQWLFWGAAAPESYQIRYTWSAAGNTTVDINSFSAKSASYKTITFSSSGNDTAAAWEDGSSVTVTDRSGGDIATIYDASIPVNIGCINSTSGAIGLLQGSISEIIVYSRAITSTERLAIENYLNKKYDLY